jgi:hypothetical protein
MKIKIDNVIFMNINDKNLNLIKCIDNNSIENITLELDENIKIYGELKIGKPIFLTCKEDNLIISIKGFYAGESNE